MSGRLKRGRRRVIVGTILIGLGVASTTWAMIPDQNGVIRGCYSKANGRVRVIDTAKGQKCVKQFEKKLSWNQKGQPGAPGEKGDTGPKGDTGDTGPKGDRGPSDAYFAWSNLNGQPINSKPAGPLGVEYLDVVLPAGRYVVAGVVTATNADVATSVECILYHGASPAGGLIGHAVGWIGKLSGPDPHQFLDLPIGGPISSSIQPTRVRAACRAGHEADNANGPSVDIGFTATRVETLTFLPTP
jgi:hypothetical protein